MEGSLFCHGGGLELDDIFTAFNELLLLSNSYAIVLLQSTYIPSRYRLKRASDQIFSEVLG